MNEPIYTAKKPSGCLMWAGLLLTISSSMLIAFFVYMIGYSEEKMDENRAEYSAYQTEYEETMKAYEADSVHRQAEYRRIQAEIEAAAARQDSTENIKVLLDSLRYYDKPEYAPRGHIGFNIAAGFFVVFILFLLIPLAIGIMLLVYHWYKRRKWRNNELFPK